MGLIFLLLPLSLISTQTFHVTTFQFKIECSVQLEPTATVHDLTERCVEQLSSKAAHPIQEYKAVGALNPDFWQ